MKTQIKSLIFAVLVITAVLVPTFVAARQTGSVTVHVSKPGGTLYVTGISDSFFYADEKGVVHMENLEEGIYYCYPEPPLGGFAVEIPDRNGNYDLEVFPKHESQTTTGVADSNSEFLPPDIDYSIIKPAERKTTATTQEVTRAADTDGTTESEEIILPTEIIVTSDTTTTDKERAKESLPISEVETSEETTEKEAKTKKAFVVKSVAFFLAFCCLIAVVVIVIRSRLKVY